jgi:hypothetical protein
MSPTSYRAAPPRIVSLTTLLGWVKSRLAPTFRPCDPSPLDPLHFWQPKDKLNNLRYIRRFRSPGLAPEQGALADITT